jgi:hypothetical protein
MRPAFARQFPSRFGDALCYGSVLLPTIGSTTRLDLVLDVLESRFPAAYHSSFLRLRYRIRGALDGTRAFSWKEAEKLSSANSETQDHVCNCRGKAVTANRWR